MVKNKDSVELDEQRAKDIQEYTKHFTKKHKRKAVVMRAELTAISPQNMLFNALSIASTELARLQRMSTAGELSMTEGLPFLWYDLDKEQLIVDDGNHRIFQKWLAGEDTFDALVYSSDWHGQLRSVYAGEDIFEWDEEDRF